MSACLCSCCSTTPAPTYSEEHRAACEARWVSKKPREWRHEYYAGVEKFRGEPAAMALVAAVREINRRPA